MSSDLISLAVVDGEPRVDSRLIADQLGVAHINTRELIEQYPADFEEFGITRFQTELSGKVGQPQKFYLLNEDQAYLLLTYTKNTPQARELKKRLVRSFAEHRRALPHAQPTLDPLAAQLAELLKGKVLVEYETLRQFVRLPSAISQLIRDMGEGLATALEQQCGRPLIADLLAEWAEKQQAPAPVPAHRAARRPVVPDYQRILDTVIREINQKTYPYPYAFRDIQGVPCLIVRTSHIMAHLRDTARLQSLYDVLEWQSDRALKRALRDAGLVIRLRCTPTIAGVRLAHAIAIPISEVLQPQLALH